jgi:hypothetical protein
VSTPLVIPWFANTADFVQAVQFDNFESHRTRSRNWFVVAQQRSVVQETRSRHIQVKGTCSRLSHYVVLRWTTRCTNANKNPSPGSQERIGERHLLITSCCVVLVCLRLSSVRVSWRGRRGDRFELLTIRWIKRLEPRLEPQRTICKYFLYLWWNHLELRAEFDTPNVTWLQWAPCLPIYTTDLKNKDRVGNFEANLGFSIGLDYHCKNICRSSLKQPAEPGDESEVTDFELCQHCQNLNHQTVASLCFFVLLADNHH